MQCTVAVCHTLDRMSANQRSKMTKPHCSCRLSLIYTVVKIAIKTVVATGYFNNGMV